ncbi:MAG: DNA repair protein RadC, partial [Pseudomonadota bacterium]
MQKDLLENLKDDSDDAIFNNHDNIESNFSTKSINISAPDKKELPHYIGHRQRLREKLINSTPNTLPDYEILEILLFSAMPRGDVKPLAKNLIKRFGSFSRVLLANSEELREVGKLKDNVIANILAINESITRILVDKVQAKPILNNWKSLLDYCRATMGYLQKEQFRIFYLNKNYMLLSDDVNSDGTVDQTPVYPREIVKRALTLEACHIILVHNHPSGRLDPSQEDIDLTLRIQSSIMPRSTSSRASPDATASSPLPTAWSSTTCLSAPWRRRRSTC